MLHRYNAEQTIKPLKGINADYSISISGVILDPNGLVINPRFDGQDYFVQIIFDGELKEYNLTTLMVCYFKFIDKFIPIDKWKYIESFFIDGNVENLSIANIGYRFIGGPLETQLKDFFYIPGFLHRAISKDMVLISTIDYLQRQWSITSPGNKNSTGGYYYNRSTVDNVITVMLRHRALMLVFKEYPNHVDKLISNHINGIPGDDRLENLEWVTYQRNLEHAYETGLRSQNKPILARNVRTGEVIRYYSISECARNVDINPGTLMCRLIDSNGENKVYPEGYQYKFADSKEDWIIPKDPEKAIFESVQAKSILVRDCSNLEVALYKSICEAARTVSIPDSSISLRLRTDNRKPLFGFQFKFIDDERDWLDFTEEELKNSLKKSRTSVDAKNPLTNEVLTFPSISKAVASGLASKHLANSLNDGKQPIYASGWVFKYSESEWLDLPGDFAEVVYALNNEVMAKHEETDTVIVANNSVEMSKLLQLNKVSIRKAALSKGKELYGGYRFRLGVTSDSWSTCNR